MLGEVRSATVSLRAGKWYVSILTAREEEQPVPHGPTVGIDVGVTRFATMSDGTYAAPLATGAPIALMYLLGPRWNVGWLREGLLYGVQPECARSFDLQHNEL